jgi:hypothetical protein
VRLVRIESQYRIGLLFMGYAARRNATFLAWKSINQWKT